MKNSKKQLLLIVSFLLSFLGFSQQTHEVAGVAIQESITYGEEELSYNGSGIREKLWFDLYVGVLYLQEKSNDATAIVASEKPMAIRLHILSSMISKKKLMSAFKDGIQMANSEEQVMKHLQQTNKFLSFVKDEVKVGDIFDFVALPEGKGMQLYRDGILLGSVEGREFKELMFNIWLSQTSVDKDLKEGMLGIN